MDIDTFEDHHLPFVYSSDDSTCESNFQCDSTSDQYNNASIIEIEDDNNSLLSETSKSERIEIEGKSNKYSMNKTHEQKMIADDVTEVVPKVGIPDQQVSIKENKISSLFCEESIPFDDEKTTPLTLVSSATVIKPTTTDSKLQSISSRISVNASCSKTNQGLQSMSSIGSKSKIHLVPFNNMNYRIATSSKLKEMANAYEISKSVQNKQPETASKFVARIQKLPGGKYKVIPTQGKVPIGLEKVFKRNPQFVKQKTVTGSVNSCTFSNSTHTQQQTQVPSGKYFKPFDFGSKSRDIKFIPHTVTSNSRLENKNYIIDGNGVQMKTNYQRKQVSSGLILSPKSQSLMYTDGQSLSVTKYGKSTKNVYNTMEYVSIKERDNSTKSNTEIGDSANSITIPSTEKIVKDTEVIKHPTTIEEMSGVISEDQEELSDEEDDQSGRFVSCHYQYCHTLVFEPELIDGLYCSLTCKNIQAKQMVAVEESNNDDEKTTNTVKKSVVDQKSIASEIKVKVSKRKHSSTSPCLEKMARNNDWSDDEQYDDICCELPVDENEFPQNVSDQTKTLEIEDGGDMIVHLKSLICDERVLNYMEEMQFRAAPNHVFLKPFPIGNNLFKVGQKLEGIDPEHEALFCVMTVVQVCGYRIRLHFDGYPDIYDFWVNADSPDLFYAGWCEENSRILQPPKNYEKKFDWTSYLETSNASAAPKQNFASTKMLANCKKHLFQIGDKLEALDVLTRTLPKQIVCVCTVADIIGNRIRIHYDGWTDDYDCWMDITSTNIHPVGWAKINGRSLARPSGYNDYRGKKPFTWTGYLKETKSKPVPEEAFVSRPLRDFAINTVIEVVDIAYPLLIRIAEILDVRGDELKILYDGFAEKYAYWVEDDSPDIHPIGWSIKTNHPIEIPAEENELADCRIKGCTGKGNTNNLNAYNHLVTKDCPYEFDSWENSITGLTKLLDRLKDVNILKSTRAISSTSETILNSEDLQNGKNKWNANAHNNILNYKGKIIDNKANVQFSMKHTDFNPRLNKHSIASNSTNEKLRNDICLSFGSHSFGYSFMAKQNRIWTRHNAQLGIPMFNTTDARNWSSLEVATYVDQVVTNNYSIHNVEGHINISQRFLDQEIDGDVFLMLNQNEIIQLMKIPFGHAIKIYSAIAMLRQRVPVFDWVDASVSH